MGTRSTLHWNPIKARIIREQGHQGPQKVRWDFSTRTLWDRGLKSGSSSFLPLGYMPAGAALTPRPWPEPCSKCLAAAAAPAAVEATTI